MSFLALTSPKLDESYVNERKNTGLTVAIVPIRLGKFAADDDKEVFQGRCSSASLMEV